MRRTVARTSKSGNQRCPSGKTRFRDHESAQRRVRTLADSSRSSVPVRSYQCQMCKGWHVTSDTRP